MGRSDWKYGNRCQAAWAIALAAWLIVVDSDLDGFKKSLLLLGLRRASAFFVEEFAEKA